MEVLLKTLFRLNALKTIQKHPPGFSQIGAFHRSNRSN
jgi:hypothetical protein